MKLPNNPKDKSNHAPGRGSDKQHEHPPVETPERTTEDDPSKQNTG